jgi:hypothetical protein
VSNTDTETALLKVEAKIAVVTKSLGRLSRNRSHELALRGSLDLHRQLAGLHRQASLLWRTLAMEYAEQTARANNERRS